MDAVAARRFRLAGRLYQKGESLTLPVDQFHSLAGAGLVARPSAAPRVAPRPSAPASAPRKRSAPKRKPATKKAG